MALRGSFLSISLSIALSIALGSTGCSSQAALSPAPAHAPAGEPSSDALSTEPGEFGGAQLTEPYGSEVSDPFEGFNRAMFSFNDKVYVLFLRPLSKAYDALVPNPAQRGIRNFFLNLRYPIFLVSDVVQLKFNQAGNHTMRFLINSTAGIVGIFDVATDFNFPEHLEDFGTALGYHGVGEGPYLVIPLLGPSNARDLLGRIVDGALNPTTYINYFSFDTATQNAVTISMRGIEVLDDTNRSSEAIDLAKTASLDYYLFVRSAYHQRRESLIYDGKVPGGEISDEPQLDGEEKQVPVIGQ